jgi:hypothetical protein
MSQDGPSTIGWLPIATAPKDRYLLLYMDGQIYVGGWFEKQWNSKARWDAWLPKGVHGETGLWRPTHWMPLPELPDGF